MTFLSTTLGIPLKTCCNIKCNINILIIKKIQSHSLTIACSYPSGFILGMRWTLVLFRIVWTRRSLEYCWQRYLARSRSSSLPITSLPCMLATYLNSGFPGIRGFLCFKQFKSNNNALKCLEENDLLIEYVNWYHTIYHTN